MPYIKQEDRDAIREGQRAVETPGELNYAISLIIYEYYLRHNGYQSINDIIGALEGAKLEFYRRVAAPYEDTKIAENGDVY